MKKIIILALCLAPYAAMAEDEGALAVAEYQVDGSMFQIIADLEQEKVLMQLEKERAQLDLDLDSLAADKVKLQMELETISGRAEEQQAKLEQEKRKLEAERDTLAKQKENIEAQARNGAAANAGAARPAQKEEPAETDIAKKYRLIEITGAGRQLQATLEDLDNGQKKKIWAGKNIDGYEIKSISLDDGVIFSKDGETMSLNVGK